MARRRADASSTAIEDALQALTADHLDDEIVTRDGIARAALTLVRDTVRACGGFPSEITAKHAAVNHAGATSARLAREALAVWEEVVPEPDPDDVPPF